LLRASSLSRRRLSRAFGGRSDPNGAVAVNRVWIDLHLSGPYRSSDARLSATAPDILFCCRILEKAEEVLTLVEKQATAFRSRASTTLRCQILSEPAGGHSRVPFLSLRRAQLPGFPARTFKALIERSSVHEATTQFFVPSTSRRRT